jgi:8-oxo-dGTP pyrophosphatase MutT (NUDIX family)
VSVSAVVHRRALLDLLEAYLLRYPEDHVRVDHVRQFVRGHPDCFERTCVEGHVTGSVWLLSPDRRSVLLTHHRKLDRWLQLGGHADGEPDPFRAALREAREESGLERFTVPGGGTPPLPLDVDVHRIPAHGGEPAHLHHDIRYLLVAEPDQTLRTSAESRALRWVARDRLRELVAEDSMLRMERKARLLVGSG